MYDMSADVRRDLTLRHHWLETGGVIKPLVYNSQVTRQVNVFNHSQASGFLDIKIRTRNSEN